MPIFLALLAPILWGSTYATVGLFLQQQSPVWVAVRRALPAGVLLLLIHPAKPPLPAKRMLLLSFCNIAAFFLLLFIAAYRLAGIASVGFLPNPASSPDPVGVVAALAGLPAARLAGTFVAGAGSGR